VTPCNNEVSNLIARSRRYAQPQLSTLQIIAQREEWTYPLRQAESSMLRMRPSIRRRLPTHHRSRTRTDQEVAPGTHLTFRHLPRLRRELALSCWASSPNSMSRCRMISTCNGH